MEEILYIENEASLALIEAELKTLDIEYFVKKTDISVLPSNMNKTHCALLFYDNKNQDTILEICDNIRISEKIEIEKEQYDGIQKKLRSVIVIAIFFIILIIIIASQATTYKDLLDAINRPSDAYTYKYLNDGKEMEVYFKKDNSRMDKYIDNNKNGINERVESHYTNGVITIYEDKNENGNFEHEMAFKDNKLLYESFSTKDNNIFDITHYYNDDGIIEQTVLYDEETNRITIN